MVFFLRSWIYCKWRYKNEIITDTINATVGVNNHPEKTFTTILKLIASIFLITPIPNTAKEFSETEQFKAIEKREGKPVVKVRHLEETHFIEADDGAQNEQYQEQILLCSSEQREKKEKAIVSNAAERFLAEKEFRTLKGDLGLRPNFHQLSDRVNQWS